MVEMEHSYILNKNKFIKIFILSSFLFIFVSCTNIPINRKWQDIRTVRSNRKELRVGDIIIKNKLVKNPMGWYGHSAMVVKPDIMGDYPELGVGYYEIDTYSWLYEDRKVMVLRYKNFDEKFKKVFVENLKKYTDKGYFIRGKKNPNSFYCSKYIWYIYYITAKELGYELDLDSDGGFMVFPYDLIGSKDLEHIIF